MALTTGEEGPERSRIARRRQSALTEVCRSPRPWQSAAERMTAARTEEASPALEVEAGVIRRRTNEKEAEEEERRRAGLEGPGGAPGAA